jgi:hypothetical protein
MVTLKGRTFNIKSTLNGGASLSDVAVFRKGGAGGWPYFSGVQVARDLFKDHNPKENYEKKTDKKPWCVDLFTSNCPNNNQLPILHHTYVNIIK